MTIEEFEKLKVGDRVRHPYKKRAASISARLLLNIYGQDLKAAANIIDAEAKTIEGDESGYATLTDALATARDFIQELINVMLLQQ